LEIAPKALDDICFDVVDLFLEEHDFPVLRDRLLMNLRAELDSVEVLREVWLKYMNGNPERIIDVYERTNDHKGSAHYENLIDIFLISFAAELLAAIVAEEYSRNRDEIIATVRKLCDKSHKRIKLAIKKISKKYDHFLKYLFRVYALKEYMERMRITFSEFAQLRQRIREVLDQKSGKALPESFDKFEKTFLEEHSLPSLAESYSEKLSEDLLRLLTKIDQRTRTKQRIETRESSGVSYPKVDVFHFTVSALHKRLEGLAVSKGYATGKIAVLKDAYDCDKVENGDILVFIDCNPDFISAVHIAGALIADRGGHTGHAAIVGRELSLPTVVGTVKGTTTLKDGMRVFVDAMQGVVYEIIC
jgi:phosphohistidine swiveling domain-containing protein